MLESDRVRLYNLIREHFNLGEIQELCFVLHIEYEDLPGDTLMTKAIELVKYCEDRGRLSDLVTVCEQERPHVIWPTFYGSSPTGRAPIIYIDPSSMERPPRLFGRDELIEELEALPNAPRRVLLFGLGGSGKTVIAKTVAFRRLQRGGGPVIWYEMAHADTATVFDALANRLGTEAERQRINKAVGQAEIDALRAILTRHAGSLLVLDNVWNPRALGRLLRTLPSRMRVLITSRLKFVLTETIAIEDLSPKAALELLSHHAGQDYREDERAKELCRILGYHAYAVEIAGGILKYDHRVRQRRLQAIAQAPAEMKVPGGFLDKPTVAALLQESYQALDDPEAKDVFRAVGALSAAGTTPDFLAVYMHREPLAVWESLETLVQKSLAKYQLADYSAIGDREIDYYTFHDLTFSYARSLFRDEGGDPDRLIPAVREYVSQYASQTAYLHQDLANILATARQARLEDEEAFVSIMQPLAVGGYMDNHGHTLELLSLLDAVIDIVRGRGEESREELHLLISKRANAFAERGDWANALIAYQETYDTAPNSQRRAMALSIMGRILYSQSEFERGDALFSQGLALAQAQDDDFAWAFALQQRTAAAGNNGDYEKAKDYGSQAVAVARRFKEQAPSFWGYSLVNLGSAEMHLGNLSNAIEIHQEALAIGEQEANSRLKADALHALGLDLHAMGEYAEARDKLNQATKIYQAIGNTVKEAEVVVFLNRAEELGK